MVHKPGGKLYGSATVGERGQVVIPAAARSELDIKPGDKVVVFGFGGKGLMMMKAESLARFVSRSMEQLSTLEKVVRESEEK